ncbi:FecR domain-containing protein [Flavobacterium rakeshii]|uniref:FecR family protein n=1 Tax=Flavobacterium rakeshii TaxID=1038845 RepID=UPI002E7B6164|nr:FecR domain-containing protein [Flavobacterium rakeshii]MEE1897796.1 FecR domain-containing protein [Flavobacterium rakeshii]
MKKEDFIVLAQKYASGNCNEEEKTAVEAYFEKMQKTTDDIPEYILDSKRDSIYNEITKAIKPVKVIPLWKKAIRVAATLFIVAGLAFCYTLINKEIPTVTEFAAKGEKKEVMLHDGSVVVLNSNSSISYPEEFGKTREVTLEGEAYFKVFRNPQQPFIVQTHKVDIKVLGTSFNINAYDTLNTKVTVLTGKVQVSDEAGKKVFLIKNEQAEYTTQNEFVLSKENSSDGIAWTKNIIILKDNTLAETARILENWYNVTIKFEDSSLENLTMTGKYKNEKLENILESIAFLKEVKIDYLTKNQIIIRRNTQH